MKKFFKIFGITLAAIVLVALVAFILGYRMFYNIQAAYEDIGPLNLEDIPDGVYTGTGGDFIVRATVDVTVEDHRITEIRIVKQTSGSKYKALDILPRIIEQQSAEVDAVSGATSSSKVIMAATYNALTGG